MRLDPFRRSPSKGRVTQIMCNVRACTLNQRSQVPCPVQSLVLPVLKIRFAVAPCNCSFVRMCGSEKNPLDLDVSKQYALFVLRRDCCYSHRAHSRISFTCFESEPFVCFLFQNRICFQRHWPTWVETRTFFH